VLEHLRDAGAGALHGLGQRGVAGEIEFGHAGVDEEADGAGEPGLVADGKGGADEEGFLAGVPVNHGAEGGQADHEGAEAERAALGKGPAKGLEVLYE